MPRFRILFLIVTTVAACAAPPPPAANGPDTTNMPALFYSKDGAVYVSDPAGTPGRKLTDGPADTEPAPSPDGSRVAFVRKASRADGGGELWVLDLSTDGAPASPPRRLVDPAALVPTFGGDDPAASTLDSPRWSPAGDRIAFLKTAGGGGFLQTAAADTGAVQAPARPLYADRKYAWARDGKHIAWAGGRSDVSPVDVSVYSIGGGSQPVATGTNTASVGYADDGRSVLFANGDATGSLFSAIPFTLRGGGVYSVEVPGLPVRCSPARVPTTTWRRCGAVRSGSRSGVPTSGRRASRCSPTVGHRTRSPTRAVMPPDRNGWATPWPTSAPPTSGRC